VRLARALPRVARGFGRPADVVVVREFRKVLTGEHQDTGEVPAGQGGGDLLLLAFASFHRGRACGSDLTAGSPYSARSCGRVSADGQRPVSSEAERSGMIALANQPAPDIGTEDGLRHALRAYGPELRSFAARRLGSWGAAEDVVQETMLRAWRRADRFDPTRGTLRGWLYSILRNLIIDVARSAASRPQTVPIMIDVAGPDEVEALVVSLSMATALQRLNVEHRQVVYYCTLKQRPHAEVARLLGVPIGTIRSRLFYAREALKLAMHDTDVAQETARSEAA